MIFLPEKRMIHKFSREDARITEDHITDIFKWIMPRDIEIMKLLLKHPFLTTSQIEMMIFNNLKPSCWRNKANERLRKLYNSQCVDRFFPPVGESMGSSEAHYILDYAGAKVIQKVYGFKGKSKFKKRSYVPQDYKHSLKVFDFEALLNVLNRQLGYTDEGTIGEIIHWNHKAYYEYIHAHDGKVKKKIIKPDAFCIYKYTANNKIKHFYLECDNDTEPLDTLKDKIINYNAFYKSNEWKREKWYTDPIKRFPTVLFVFHEQEKVNRMVEFVRRKESNIRFLFTTYDQLFEDRYERSNPNKYGKTRLVLQERKIKILDGIWATKNGLESL